MAEEAKKKREMKEYFTVPNLMGYFRILMIPVFLILYFNEDTPPGRTGAFVALGLSILTDFFDGKIARKFHMETDLGKALDPVADKLTQGAVAVVTALQYPLMIPFTVLFALKETYMGIMGYYLKKKKNFWNGAKWHGKIYTAVLDIGVFCLLLFPNLPPVLANGIVLVMFCCMAYSWIRYSMLHMSVLKDVTVPRDTGI